MHYDVDFCLTDSPSDLYVGKLTLWIEGFFVKGYLMLYKTPVGD